jgi:MAF protein
MIEGYDFVLASGSPRREELLRISGWKVILRPVVLEEVPCLEEAPIAYAKRLALEKAEKARDEDHLFILGADTIVVHECRILGKPKSEKEATMMLQELQDKAHQVITAIALLDPIGGRSCVDTCETRVPMRAYQDTEIEAYVASGSPMDKAGAYGIQDERFHPVQVEMMEGCYANVMGLPLCHLQRSLGVFGSEAPSVVPERCMAFTNYDCQVYEEILQVVI